MMMKLLIHSQTSTVAPLKFENGWIISSHTFLGMWLLIHFGIKLNLRYSRVDHGSILGNWRPYWNDLKTHIVFVSSILLCTCSNISMIPEIIFLTAYCHLRQNCYCTKADSGNVRNWQPYWNDPSIWILLVIITQNIEFVIKIFS